MGDSESFGAEIGFGTKVVDWLNNEAKNKKKKFEARLYNYEIATQNFGSFEMFSWIGDVNVARDLIQKASKRFKIKVLEGAYKPNVRVYKTHKTEYAMVRRGDKVLGHLEFTTSMFGGKWKLKAEERK